MKYYLAIDIGASSGRHILGSFDGEKMYAEEIYRFPNLPTTKKTPDGTEHLCWDTERLFSEIVEGLKVAGKMGKIPESVGIDTWGVDYALLDKDGKIIDGVFCYRDARTDKTVPLVHGIIPESELFSKTGIAFATFNSIYQLYDDKLTGKLDGAKAFLTLPDYFHYLLTGVIKHEYTDATTTGMVNAKTHAWDGEILDKLGYPREIFGELSQPGTTVGEFTDEIAVAVGYKTKVVLPATHDTGSAVLAAPLEAETPYISSGTWSLLGVEQKNAYTAESARLSGYSNEGSVNFGFRLQKNIMGLWMIQQIRHELDDKYSFSELVELAKASPIEDRVDVNEQRFMAPKSMIAEINSAAGRELSVGEMAYFVYNNLAECYARSLSDLEELTGEKYDTLNIIGGGSKNGFLNELTKKKTGKRIITGPAEGTAIGNLLVQMTADGVFESIKAGRAVIKRSFDINEV